MFYDYHVHLENGPFDMGWLDQFASTAAKEGLGGFGVSEHMFRFHEAGMLRPSWWGYGPDCSLGDYLELIAEAKSMGLPVALGIEAEYIHGLERQTAGFLREAPWDYVIGSVHCMGEWGFDDEAEIDVWNSTDVDEAYRSYFDLLGKAIRSGLYDIVGHPDVIKVFGRRPSFDLRPFYESVARTAGAAGLAIEVSTAGLRKPVAEMYPHPEFLRAFARNGVPIVVSSDAHYPQHVGYEFRHAARFAVEAGYHTVTRFEARKACQVALG